MTAHEQLLLSDLSRQDSSQSSPSGRFQVVSYGHRAYEVQDTATRRHVCVVGMPDETHARNRHAGEAMRPPDEETLALARAVAAALDAAAERGEGPWKVAASAGDAGAEREGAEG